VDVKYVPKNCLVGELAGGRLYQYTAIDECTRWRYTEIFDEHSTYSSVEFVKHLVQRFPLEILCIQTDNGAEFTSRYTGANHPSAFEAHLAEQGIRHKLIAPATPRHNGKVERSHRTDQERFYNDNKFFSLHYLKEQASRYLRQSNRQPLMVHSWRSAHQMLQNYLAVL
jgi:transposase InsO family protein